jgi:hypothetical protein
MVRPRKDGSPSAPCRKPEGRPLKWTKEAIEAEADLLLEWSKKPSSLYFEEFCVERGYPGRYLTEFATENEKFGTTLEHIHTWQKCKLVRGSLLKKLDSGISKLLLSGYGIKDQQTIEHTGNVTVSIIDYANANKKDK